MEAQIGTQFYPADEESSDWMWYDADVRITTNGAFPDLAIVSAFSSQREDRKSRLRESLERHRSRPVALC